nr:agglutinin-like protein [Spathaspora passalidarum]
MISYLILVTFSLSITLSKQITGVFTSFDSLEWEGKGEPMPAYPTWWASLSWEIDGSIMNSGDTFTLHMPCVFKFATSEDQLDLVTVNPDTGNPITYAACNLISGDVVVSFSELQCILSEEVQASTHVFGSLNVPIIFNIGFAGSNVDLVCASMFQKGTNMISFSDGDTIISTEAEFGQGRTQMFRESSVLNKAELILVHDNFDLCGEGLSLLGLVMEFETPGGRFDCNSMGVGITNELNAWGAPTTFEKLLEPIPICDNTLFAYDFRRGVPPGFPFIYISVKLPNRQPYFITLSTIYNCDGGGDAYRTTSSISGTYANDDPGPDVDAVDLVTQTYTGSSTQVSTVTFDPNLDRTMTIIVQVPVPTVTETSTYDGKTTSYTTITAEPGSTGTVIEFVPDYASEEISTVIESSNQDEETEWTAPLSEHTFESQLSIIEGETDWTRASGESTEREESGTSTTSNRYTTSNSPATVTETRTGTGSGTQSITLSNDSGVNETVTEIVVVPTPTVTIASTYGGTSTSYTTISDGPGSTVTVIEYRPIQSSNNVDSAGNSIRSHTTVTITGTWTGLTTRVTTLPFNPDIDDNVTVAVEIPIATVVATYDESKTMYSTKSGKIVGTFEGHLSGDTENIVTSTDPTRDAVIEKGIEIESGNASSSSFPYLVILLACLINFLVF